VYRFYSDNKDKGKMYTIEHFKRENQYERTTRRIIDRFNNGIDVNHLKGAGRPAVKMPKRKVTHLKRLFDNKDGISQSRAASKFGVSQQYIGKILRSKSQIRKRKKMTIPKRTERQKIEGRTKCSTLWRKLANVDVVMDDESYFTLGHSTINGNDIFYTSNIDKASDKIKYKEKSKYEKKVLVWVAASVHGLSEPLITPSGLAINQYIYADECIRRRLLPFIRSNHSDNNYQFWPDLASSHYASSVQDFLRENNVNFVNKDDNPANLPEVRPIENFWSLLKAKVYEDGWQANDIPQLTRKIRKCLKNFDKDLIHRLFSGVRSRLDKVRRVGVVGKNT